MENLTTLENEELMEIIGGVNWGKCIAGTIGGAIGGGLSGLAAGSAIPVFGTGAVGVAGAIGGGLVAAAGSC